MYKSLDFTQTGGLYIYQETLDWMQNAYSSLIDAIAAMYGNKVILSGVTPAGGNVSDGWVCVNGEILPFVGGAVTALVYVKTQTTNEQYDDGMQKPFYTTKSVNFTAVANGTSFNYTDLVRLPFTSTTLPTLKDALNGIQTFFKYLVQFENCVIVSGCLVTNINTGAGTCDISSGVAMINGAIVNAPAKVAQSYPCYLKSDGTYVTVDPGGDRISFDPNTSQYYTDVLRRAQNTKGAILMQSNSNNDLDYFDAATGLGKWKWLGWKICDLLQSRVPVGYDRRAADPVDGIWDANYNTAAHKDAALQNKRQLAQTNLPHVRINVTGQRGNSYTGGPTSDTISGSGLVDSGTHSVGQTDYLGDGTAWDIRQSYSVILYIERL